MKTKNKIGKIVFAIIGLWAIFLVFYPLSLQKLYLTDRPAEPFGWTDIALLSIGFVFFWGSYKFISLADSIIEGWKSRFTKKNV